MLPRILIGYLKTKPFFYVVYISIVAIVVEAVRFDLPVCHE